MISATLAPLLSHFNILVPFFGRRGSCSPKKSSRLPRSSYEPTRLPNSGVILTQQRPQRQRDPMEPLLRRTRSMKAFSPGISAVAVKGSALAVLADRFTGSTHRWRRNWGDRGPMVKAFQPHGLALSRLLNRLFGGYQGGHDGRIVSKEGSVLVKANRLLGALIHTGPALNAIVWMNGERPPSTDHVDLVGADLHTVAATDTSVFVKHRIHEPPCRKKSLRNEERSS